MKRAILIFAAAMALGLPLGEAALARDHGGGQGRGRPERQDARPPERRDEGRRYDPRRDEGPRPPVRAFREDDRRPPVRSFRDDGDRGGRWDERRYEDGPYPPADARPARRGGYLPDAYRGGRVDDYQRYRLRAPPRGYAWVRVGAGFALVSLDDGRIFDMVQ